jgi:hypothetical protein
MLGVNRPPFIDRRKPHRFDEFGILAIVCFTLAAAIIILAMALGPRAARSETPTSCKAWSGWCDTRKPSHWHYGNCNLIWQYCDIG